MGGIQIKQIENVGTGNWRQIKQWVPISTGRWAERQGRGGAGGLRVWVWWGSGCLQSVTGSSCWDEIRSKTLKTGLSQEMRCQAGDLVPERQHDILENGGSFRQN